MAGTSNYPGALDNFSAASPTNLGDDDSTGRNHGERHDDLEAAVEAVQGELGINPAGTATTVVARLDGLDSSKAPVANPTFTGVAQFPDGSASAPSITNTGDTNTGIAFPADDTVAIATGGSERLRVTSAGRLALGSSSADSVIDVRGTAFVTTSAYLRRYSANNDSPYLVIGKSRGATTSGLDAVLSGDRLGRVAFVGTDGANWPSFAHIEAFADSNAAVGSNPGRLSFATTPSGSATSTERMRIDSNGLITGTGTSLGAWTAYTPTLGGTGWAIGNGTATGAYCQIGKLIYFRAEITFGSTSTFGASAEPTITGPANVKSGINGNHHLQVKFLDSSASAEYFGWVSTTASSPLTFSISYLTTNSQKATINSTTPITWATSDRIQVTGFVEAA